jgi:hypothetical protein
MVLDFLYISPNSFVCFIDYELLCDFLQSHKYYVKIICIKGQEGINHVMASNEFGNDSMIMCFEHKNNNEVSL